MTDGLSSGRRDSPPPVDDDIASQAVLLAMCVRNALEGTLHGGERADGLTDAQMARLNPLVRNAVATGLHAARHYLRERAARAYLDFQHRLVPEYWERPELLPDYVELWHHFADLPDDPQHRCRRCGRAIVDIGTSEAPRWTHVAAETGVNVGCRAASYTSQDGWNDDIPRSWKATP